MRTNVSLVSNVDHETRKNKNKKTTNVNKNPIRLYYKEETKQSYDKKTYPKLVLNRPKVMKNSILFISLSI